jgi:PhoH-like ATPase
MERVNYLLDTNVLLKFGLMDFIETKSNAGIIIPMVVIQELDRQKYLDGVLGYQARKAIREIADIKKYGDIKEWVSLQNNISVHVEKDFDESARKLVTLVVS